MFLLKFTTCANVNAISVE